MNIRGGLFLGLAALLLGTPGCGGGDCENPNPNYNAADPTSEACLDDALAAMNSRPGNEAGAEGGPGEEGGEGSLSGPGDEGGGSGPGGEGGSEGEQQFVELRGEMVLDGGNLELGIQRQKTDFVVAKRYNPVYVEGSDPPELLHKKDLHYIFPDGTLQGSHEAAYQAPYGNQVEISHSPYARFQEAWPIEKPDLTPENTCNNYSDDGCDFLVGIMMYGELIGTVLPPTGSGEWKDFQGTFDDKIVFASESANAINIDTWEVYDAEDFRGKSWSAMPAPIFSHSTGDYRKFGEILALNSDFFLFTTRICNPSSPTTCQKSNGDLWDGDSHGETDRLWLVDFDGKNASAPQELTVPFPIHWCGGAALNSVTAASGYPASDQFTVIYCSRGYHSNPMSSYQQPILAGENGWVHLLVDANTGEVTPIEEYLFKNGIDYGEDENTTRYSYSPEPSTIEEGPDGPTVVYVENVSFPAGTFPKNQQNLKVWKGGTTQVVDTVKEDEEGYNGSVYYSDRFKETFFMTVNGERVLHYVVTNTLYRWTPEGGSEKVTVLCDQLDPGEEPEYEFHKCRQFLYSAFVEPHFLYATTGVTDLSATLQKWDLSVLPGVGGEAVVGSAPPRSRAPDEEEGDRASEGNEEEDSCGPCKLGQCDGNQCIPPSCSEGQTECDCIVTQCGVSEVNQLEMTVCEALDLLAEPDCAPLALEKLLKEGCSGPCGTDGEMNFISPFEPIFAALCQIDACASLVDLINTVDGISCDTCFD